MGTLYSAAKKEGWNISLAFSHDAFSQEEEEARQGTPLTKLVFRQLASVYAKREDYRIFSCHFVSDFVG